MLEVLDRSVCLIGNCIKIQRFLVWSPGIKKDKDSRTLASQVEVSSRISSTKKNRCVRLTKHKRNWNSPRFTITSIQTDISGKAGPIRFGSSNPFYRSHLKCCKTLRDNAGINSSGSLLDRPVARELLFHSVLLVCEKVP